MQILSQQERFTFYGFSKNPIDKQKATLSLSLKVTWMHLMADIKKVINNQSGFVSQQ